MGCTLGNVAGTRWRARATGDGGTYNEIVTCGGTRWRARATGDAGSPAQPSGCWRARAGARALRVTGNAEDPSYSYVYFAVFEETLGVAPDSVLSYWIRPANERGQCVGIDLRFTDGTTLRDSGGKTADGQALHPGNTRGVIGEWTQVVIPIGRFAAGKAIEAILFAYDSRAAGGPFEAFIDDVKLESALLANAWNVGIEPPGGPVATGALVTLTPPEGASVRYTLDGTNPTVESPRYDAPIRLDKPGTQEIRYAAEWADGRLSPLVFGRLFGVGP